MEHKKFLVTLEEKLKKSFEFSKEIAKIRDSKLIEGFINKGEEECSFNEFYSNGNENIVKYAGIINGLKNKKYEFFDSIPQEFSHKIRTINDLSNELIKKNNEYNIVYNRYSLGAEFCLHDYIENNMKYINLDNRPLFYSLIDKAHDIVEKNMEGLKKNLELQKILEKAEQTTRQIVLINKMLNSNKYIKRNAFYVIKNFDWLHEKGTFENMSDLEVKVYYSKKILKEKSAKDILINGKFVLDEKTDFEKNFSFGS